MERLHVLGTGNALVTKCYNTCFAIQQDNEYFLVDAGGGNGILTALEKNEIPVEHIHNLFLTHEHTDHLLGVIWMIRIVAMKMKQGKYEGNFHIYCHEDLEKLLKIIVTSTIQAKFHPYLDTRILFHQLEDVDHREVMGYDVIFFDIGSTKAKQFGCSMTLKNGKVLTFLGDEPPKEVAYPYLEQSDWVLQEAFCLYEEREKYKPYEKHHSTVKEACEIAQRFNIANCILWHTEDSDLEHRKTRYTNEGKQYYQGNLQVPNDLDIIALD